MFRFLLGFFKAGQKFTQLVKPIPLVNQIKRAKGDQLVPNSSLKFYPLISKNFSLKRLTLLFRAFTWSQIILLFASGLGALLFYGVDHILRINDHNIQWPVSLDSVMTALTSVFVFNILWSGMLLFNHFADLVPLFTNWYSQGTPEFIGSVASFWYVGVFSVTKDFLTTLFTNPASIAGTCFIQEIILAYSNVSFQLHSLLSVVVNLIPNLTVHGWFNTALEGLSDWAWSLTTVPFKLLNLGWVKLWTGIAGYITPTVPSVIQPVVDAVIAPAAKTLAVSFLLWLIRYLFGFF